jgi:hypothetical protein
MFHTLFEGEDLTRLGGATHTRIRLSTRTYNHNSHSTNRQVSHISPTYRVLSIDPQAVSMFQFFLFVL